MSLDTLFRPRAVALIGASADPSSISARPLRMLAQHGYAGGLYPVNPRYQELMGRKVYPSIAAVPEPVDLALVAVPAPVVRRVLEECAAAGVQHAVILSSGFAETGPEGARLQAELAEVVAQSSLRVGGPNCEGLFYAASGLCATFSPALDPEHGYQPGAQGTIAIVSQSGGLGFAILNRGRELGLGFGAVVSTGNEVDLGWLDYVDALLDDPSIRLVLGFVEGLRHAERLVSVAHKAARLNKPIVLAKIGRSEAGRRAAASHTASLAGSDAVYSAALRQLGIIRVDDVDELLDVAAFLSVGRLPAGPRLGVLTTSGGAGAWLSDAASARGLQLPPPPAAVQDEIRSFIPPYGSVINPVDISAQAALGGGFERALGLLVRSGAYDLVAGVGSMVREDRFVQTLPELRQAIEGASTPVVFFSYTRPSVATIESLAELGIPCYSTPVRAARGMAAAVQYRQFLDGIDQVGVWRTGDRPAATWPAPLGRLSEREAYAYLAPLGIPAPEACLATSAEQAVEQFLALGGGPVALKVQSADLPHKTDVGGVRLGLATAEAVRAAYAEIDAAVRQAAPTARLDGVLVQRMAPEGVELIVAARRDPQLGPIVVVGLGGVHVELLGDVAIRLAPVTRTEARAMLEQLQGAALLRGLRGRPAADTGAVVEVLVRLSELAAGLPPGVSNVELNPLLALPAGQGVLMLDAAIELSPEAT